MPSGISISDINSPVTGLNIFSALLAGYIPVLPAKTTRLPKTWLESSSRKTEFMTAPVGASEVTNSFAPEKYTRPPLTTGNALSFGLLPV